MEFGWSQELQEFWSELRAFADGKVNEDFSQQAEEGPLNPKVIALKKEMDERGWLKQAWPKEYGGDGKSAWYQYILGEEMAYRGISMVDMSTGSVGPAIARFGSEEQKKKYLPDIWGGKMFFALGYSEPGAGTDLASLQTRAVRDGDVWVINGQKLWTSQAHAATHVWLAARTDTSAPKHRGISVFIVPLDAPGITVRPIITMSGMRTNETFYENVRVPADALIGDENRGWYIIANALDHERVALSPLGPLAATFDRLMSYLQERRPDLLKEPNVRLRLAELKLDLHVQRALTLQNAAVIANGQTPNAEASMAKVWSSELRYRLNSVGMELLGRYGALSPESGDEAPLHGTLDIAFRSSPVLRFGAGTNEVQRNIIAQRGLGLPR
jgi:3-oxocholest-4-en-26-oyl-CoA dehydrogenase alpha subunit